MDKQLKKRLIVVSALVIVLTLITGAILTLLEIPRVQAREQLDCQLKLDAVAEVVHTVETQRIAAKASFEGHIRENVRMMIAALKTDVTEEAYTGPALFEDGAVVMLRGGKAVWPEGVPAGMPELSEDDIRSGEFITRDVPLSTIKKNGGENPEEGTKRVIFLAGQIAGDYWYVDWTPEDEILLEQYSCLKDEEFLKVAEESFGGYLLIVSAVDPSVPMLKESAFWPGINSAAELGLTQEILAEKRSIVTVNGKRSLCCYADDDGGVATLIYVKPVDEMVMHAVLHVAMIQVSSILILASLIGYIFAVRQYVKAKKLSRVLLKRYQPKTFRRIIAMAGLTGAIAIFVCTAVFQTLDAIHDDSIIGAGTLNRLFEYLQNTTTERLDKDQKEEADWDSYQAERLASLIAQRPELGTREKLQEYCDILNIDYIMLFDAEGRETVTNSNYTGLTLDAGLGENSEDFKRLLNGVPYIVHEASTDPVTGLTRQMIGAAMPAVSESGEPGHGALIMAVPPKTIKKSNLENSEQLRFIDNGVTTCFFTDPQSGKILYASDLSLIGRKVTEIGLPEKSMQTGYTDFTDIDGKPNYVTMMRQKEVNFYFGLSTRFVFGSTLPAAGLGVIAFLLVLWIVLPISLKGYNNETFKERTDANLKSDADEEDEYEEKKKQNFSELLISNTRSFEKLKDRTPEGQAGVLMKINVLLLVIIPVLAFLLNGNAPDKALLDYILYGDWMRGVSLFALCGILMVSTISLLILVVCNILLSLIAGFTGRSGETICRLLYSLIRYIAILAIIYYIFEYVGLSMSTYIASLGTVSLALSIGSRDMVADIVAGVMILFERQFQVGDYVELDGVRGQVLEMGVRSTKLLCQGDNIRYVSNSNIRSVVNKTKRLSSNTMELTIVTSDPIEKVEELFSRELAEIGKKKRQIKELSLAGISRVTGGGKPDQGKIISVRARWSCQEGDQEMVQAFINRELYLFCERENIEIR